MNRFKVSAQSAVAVLLFLGRVDVCQADGFAELAKAAAQLALDKDQTVSMKRSVNGEAVRLESGGFGVELSNQYDLSGQGNLSKGDYEARMGANADLRARIFGGNWFDIANLRARIGNYGRVDETLPRDGSAQISDVATDLQVSLFSTVVAIRRGVDAPLQINSSPVRRTIGKISVPLVAPIASITGSYGASLVNSGEMGERLVWNGEVGQLQMGQSFSPKLSAGAHVEASVNVLLARAGLGGEITLNSSEAKAYADLVVSEGVLNVGTDLRVKLLDGRAYGFVEVRRFLKGWKRLVDVNLSRFTGSQFGVNRVIAQVGLFSDEMRTCLSQECGTVANLAAAFVAPGAAGRAPASVFQRVNDRIDPVSEDGFRPIR